MKHLSYKILIPLILILFGIIRTISLIQNKKDLKVEQDIIDDIKNSGINTKRESITFILGEDKELDNPFYDEAAIYYSVNEKDKTDYLVRHCRSLKEVQEYLSENAPLNGLPWGLVNLVSHGNQWLGLSVKVTPFSKRATPDRIKEYIDNDSLMDMSESIIDENTEILVHACGLGNNQDMINSLGEVFSSSDIQPKVKASKLFEFYISEKENGIVKKSNRFDAEAKYITYKMGYRPNDQVVAEMLNLKYPNSEIDFADALKREQARFMGDTYHYTFEVPVKWVIAFEDSASYPDLSTKKLKDEWISEQNEIIKVLEKIDIPADQFNWWFRDVHVNNDDGTKSPAVWLKGYCTILCVLKPIVNEKVSEKNNTTYAGL